MDASTENIHPMQTTLALQLSENKREKVLNDVSPDINTESWLNDLSAKTDEENTIQNRTFLQMKTYDHRNTDLKTNSKAENKTRTPHSDKTEITKISLNKATVSSASSSDEEVLQTRFSSMNKNIFKSDEYHSSPILSESTLNKRSTLENDLEAKTSPIIIQAIPYREKTTANYSDNTKYISEINQQQETNNMKETNTEVTSSDFLNVEGNYPSTDIGSNSVQISNENSNEQFDVTDYLEKNDSLEVSVEQLMKNISFIAEHDSTSTEIEETKEAYDDFIVDDFLNGSFDVNTYKLENMSSVENYKNSILSNTEQFQNNKSTSTMQTNIKNKHKKNKYNKGEINELVTASKEAKWSNSYNNKNNLFQNTAEILTTGLKKKKGNTKQMKNTPKLQTEAKKKNKKSENLEEFNLKAYSKTKEKLSNTKQQKNKRNDKLFNNEEQNFSFNKFINSPNKTIQTKTNTSQKKYKGNNITSDALNKYNLRKLSPRKVRNSSLIASRKIKEIEKIENLSDFPEEILINSDEENHNSKKISNTFQTQKTYTNEVGEKHENNMAVMLTTDKNKLQSENVSREKDDSMDIAEFYFRNLFETFSLNKQNPSTKGRYKRDKNRNFTSDLNLSDEYFIQENEDLCENVQSSLKKERKDKSNDSKSADEILDNSYYTVSRDLPRKKEENFISFKGAIKESKHRTWDSLEKELLTDFDDNMPLTDNINKTVILKEEEIIRKKEVVKDTNLFTVSNTSMTQTMNKYKGNKYNMQYEIKNTESKFLESKADTTYNFQDRFNISQSKEVVHYNSKCTSILDRTIAAMEKCTANFTATQVKIYDSEQKDSSLQFEDISDNSNTNQETQFHSSITFLANDNEQYYSNKIVGYMKKSNRRSQRNINFKEKRNVCKMSDLNDQQRESDCKTSEDAEHSKKTVTARRNYLLEDYPDKSSHIEKNQPLIPYSEEKHTNPWNKLIKKLNLGEDYEKGTYPVNKFRSEGNIKKQHSESLMIKNDLSEGLNNSKRNNKMLVPIDFQMKKIKLDEMKLSEQGVLQQMLNEETETLVNHTPESKNFNLLDGSILSNTEFRSNIDKKNIQENKKNENEDKKLEKPVKEMKSKTTVNEKQTKSKKETNIKQCSKYKFKMDKNGALKLKMHSSRSSSTTSSSKSSTKSKKTASNSNKCRNYKTSKTREEYKKYLKTLFDKQDQIFKKAEIDDKTKSKEVESKEITEENTHHCKTNNPRTRMKLLAENEDIFSLSSSDSETGNEKTRGSGLLCDLFDE